MLKKMFLACFFALFFSSAFALSGPATITNISSSSPANPQPLLFYVVSYDSTALDVPLATLTASGSFVLSEENKFGEGVLPEGKAIAIAINLCLGETLPEQELSIYTGKNPGSPFKAYLPEIVFDENPNRHVFYLALDGSSFYRKILSTGQILPYMEAVANLDLIARSSERRLFEELEDNYDILGLQVFYTMQGDVVPLFYREELDSEYRVKRLSELGTGSYLDFYYDQIYQLIYGKMNRTYIRVIEGQTKKTFARAIFLEVPEKTKGFCPAGYMLCRGAENITIYPTTFFQLEVAGRPIIRMRAVNDTDAKQTTMVLSRLVSRIEVEKNGETGELGAYYEKELVKSTEIVWDSSNEDGAIDDLPLKRILSEKVWTADFDGELPWNNPASAPLSSLAYEYNDSVSTTEPAKINGFELQRTDLAGGWHEVEGPDYIYTYDAGGFLVDMVDKATGAVIPFSEKVTAFPPGSEASLAQRTIPEKPVFFSQSGLGAGARALLQNNGFCLNACSVDYITENISSDPAMFVWQPPYTELYSVRWAYNCGDSFESGRDAEGRVQYVCCLKFRTMAFDAVTGFWEEYEDMPVMNAHWAVSDITGETKQTLPFIYSHDLGAKLVGSDGCTYSHAQDYNPNIVDSPEELCEKLKNPFAARKCMEATMMDVFGKDEHQRKAILALEMIAPIGYLAANLTPVVGGLVDFYEAYRDPSPFNVTVASLNTLPGLGAVVGAAHDTGSLYRLFRRMGEFLGGKDKAPEQMLILRNLLEQAETRQDKVHMLKVLNDVFREEISAAVEAEILSEKTFGRLSPSQVAEAQKSAIALQRGLGEMASVRAGSDFRVMPDSITGLFREPNMPLRLPGTLPSKIEREALTFGEVGTLLGEKGLVVPGSRTSLFPNWVDSPEHGGQVLDGFKNPSYRANYGAEFSVLRRDPGTDYFTRLENIAVTPEMWDSPDYFVTNIKLVPGYAVGEAPGSPPIAYDDIKEYWRIQKNLQNDLIDGIYNKKHAGNVLGIGAAA